MPSSSTTSKKMAARRATRSRLAAKAVASKAAPRSAGSKNGRAGRQLQEHAAHRTRGLRPLRHAASPAAWPAPWAPARFISTAAARTPAIASTAPTTWNPSAMPARQAASVCNRMFNDESVEIRMWPTAALIHVDPEVAERKRNVARQQPKRLGTGLLVHVIQFHSMVRTYELNRSTSIPLEIVEGYFATDAEPLVHDAHGQPLLPRLRAYPPQSIVNLEPPK